MRGVPLPLVLVLAALAAPARAAEPAPAWTLDPAASRAEFSVDFLGVVRVKGRFLRFSGAIEPLPDDTVRVRARFETASLSMNTQAQERWARSDEFFDSARFPIIEYVSAAFPRARLAKGGTVAGELELRGVKQATMLRLRAADCAFDRARDCVVDATAAAQRGDFGMKSRRGMISDRVALAVHIVARPPGG